MNILNSKERNTAFGKFLGFFIITVALVVLAVFFNYRLPAAENKMLQDEISTQRKLEMDQQKFVARMEEVVLLLDSLDKEKVNYNQIDLQLSGKISDLATWQQKDNGPIAKMNKAIVSKFDELRSCKKQLRALTEQTSDVGRLRAELKQCKDDLKQAESDLDAYRRGN